MQILELPVEKRATLGSSAARRSRRASQIPCVLYGNRQDNVNLLTTYDAFEKVMKAHSRIVLLRLGDAEQTALIRQVTWDTYGEWIQHIDFVRIEMTDEVDLQIPLKFVGIPAGAGQGGVPEVLIADMPVRCRADSIPDEIRVDVSGVELNKGLHVRDLVFPANVKPAMKDMNALVFHVVEPRKLEEIAPAAAEAVAGAPAAEGAAAAPAAGKEGEKGAAKGAAPAGKEGAAKAPAAGGKEAPAKGGAPKKGEEKKK